MDGRNEFGLRPMASNFSFGGYATAQEEDNSFLERMRTAATRTRDQFASSLDGVLSLTRQVDAETLDELEAVLLTADIGLTTTQEIIGNLRTRALREKATGAELRAMLREELLAILNSVDQPTHHPTAAPEVIMMVGVNGTGKTTTSGKLAALYGTHGRRALLCAADTFRAAAIDQLEVWAQRSNVDIIKTRQGGDPSAALYDALAAGKARKADIVIVDTAGRLHNKAGLMAELEKMRRTAREARAWCTPPDVSGDGRDDGPERPAAGAPIFGGIPRERHRADQAGRDGEGWHCDRHCTGTAAAGGLCGRRREDGRHHPVRQRQFHYVPSGGVARLEPSIIAERAAT